MRKTFTRITAILAVLFFSAWGVNAQSSVTIFQETFNGLKTTNAVANALTLNPALTDQTGYVVGGGGSAMKCTTDGTMEMTGGRFETKKMDLSGEVTLTVRYKCSTASTTKKFQIDIDKTGTSGLGGILNEIGTSSPTEFTTKTFIISTGTNNSYIHFRTESSHTIVFDEIKITRTLNTPMIESFKVGDVVADIDEEAKTITAELPYGTNLSAITPAVTLGGTATSYSPVGEQDFSAGPVVFTATDGTNNVNYSVTLTVSAAASSDATLSNLKVDGIQVKDFAPGTLIYDIEFPYAFTGIPNVEATKNDAAANVNIVQATGVPGVATVTVTAQDNTVKVYTLNFIRTPASGTCDITALKINGKVGAISDAGILVKLHLTTNITALTPEITVSEFASYSPVGPQDFTSPVQYTVTAQDGTQKVYTVSVELIDMVYSGSYPYESVFPLDYEIPVWMSSPENGLSFVASYTSADKTFWYDNQDEITAGSASVLRLNSNSSLEMMLSKCEKITVKLSATGGRTFNLLVNGTQVATSGSVSSNTEVTLTHTPNLNEPLTVIVQNVGSGGATIGYLKIEGSFGSGLIKHPELSMKFDGQTISNTEKTELRLFDATGRLLVTSNNDINMNGRSKGVYIVKSEDKQLKIVYTK